MTFHWPHAFWLLLVPLILLVRDLRRRRISAANAHPKIPRATATHSSLVIGHSSFRRGGGAPRVRILLYLALAAATVALARPQWGKLEEPVFDQAREIIIALDLSRSMLATDVAPSRLERARLLITSLLEQLKGERVGLVVFSGTAFLQSPLSADYEILREFLPVLDPGYLPEGGTNYDALLDTTLSAFGASGAADRFLIVLSDGEAQGDTWRKHLDALKTKDIRVLGLGIGTAQGAMIPDGSGAFMKDERGAVVLSKLDSSTLRELSEKTDGVYADASSWVDLSQLIENTVEQGRRGEFKETNRVRLAERFQWPLAAAVILAFLSFWREFPVRPKPRSIPLASIPLKTALFALPLLHWALIRGPSSFAAEAPASAAAPVTEIVGKLASLDQPSADDFAELARATVTYGQHARQSKESVSEGAIRDALAAVDAGQSRNPKAADWPALRKQLEALLPKETPPPPKDDPSKSDEKKPEQNKKDSSKDEGQKGDKSDPSQSPDENPKNEDSKSDSSKPDPSKSTGNKNGQSSGEGDKSDDPPSGQQPQGNEEPKEPDTPGQSAFGDMKDPPPPETAEPDKKTASPDSEPGGEPGQPDSEMQQVGGAPTEPSTDPARLDPALSIPLQKLDQVKQGDSPARLFQLLQEPSSAPPAPAGNNW